MKQRKYGENGHHEVGLTDQGTDAREGEGCEVERPFKLHPDPSPVPP